MKMKTRNISPCLVFFVLCLDFCFSVVLFCFVLYEKNELREHPHKRNTDRPSNQMGWGGAKIDLRTHRNTPPQTHGKKVRTVNSTMKTNMHKRQRTQSQKGDISTRTLKQMHTKQTEKCAPKWRKTRYWYIQETARNTRPGRITLQHNRAKGENHA